MLLQRLAYSQDVRNLMATHAPTWARRGQARRNVLRGPVGATRSRIVPIKHRAGDPLLGA